MEDIIFDVLGDMLEYVAIGTVGIVAFAAAQFFFSKYKDTIYDMLKGSLLEYPRVKTVVIAVLKKNDDAVSFYIKGTRYFATRFLGLSAGSTNTQGAIALPTMPRASTRRLTAEEIEQQNIIDGIRKGELSQRQKNALESFSEEDLLALGLVPERVAKGKRLVDKNGKPLGAVTICNEQDVMNLRNSA